MRSLIVIAVLFCTACLHAQPYDLNLIPYRKGKLWGYSDSMGKMLIAPQFTEANLFEGPIAMAKLDSYYCVIDRTGKVIYKSARYTGVCDRGKHFMTQEHIDSEQLFDANARPLTKVYYRIGQFNKYGYAEITAHYTKHGLMDRSFHEVVAPQYGDIEFFGPSLIKVYEDRKGYGLVNLATGMKVECKYDQIYPPREALLMVNNAGLYGFIDATGKEMLAPKYQKETPVGIKPGEHYNESTYEDFNLDGFYDGLAVVVDNNKAGYINKSGKVAIPFTFDKAYGFYKGRAWVMKEGRWGVINKHGKYLLQPSYREAAYLSAKELLALDHFHEGLVAVATDSLYGYVDTNGRTVIPFKFQRADPFYNGLATAYTKGRMGFIDRTGAWVIPPVYEWAEGAGTFGLQPFINGLARVLKPGGGWVVIDRSGKQVIPIEFDRENYVSFDEHAAYATADGKRYVFDYTGKVVFTLPHTGLVMMYAPHLLYSFTDECFLNIRTGAKYCE